MTPKRKRWKTSLALAALALLPPTVAVAQDDGIQASAMREIGALLAEKASRTPAQRKISSRLLLDIKRQRDDPSLVGLPEMRSSLELGSDGRVLVDITAEVGDELLTRVEHLGGRVVSHHERYDAVRAEMPMDRVEALAEWSALRNIRPADYFFTRATVTEGDVAHKADVARTAQDVDGTGVKVCAMSDSVDELATLQGTGELPAGVTVLAGQDGTPGSSEGTALLEIIHDMAPGSDLGFATGKGGLAQMATNILALEADDCDVIVDDVGYIPTSVFQDDVIAQAVDTVAAKGVIYFSAAGNAGNKNDGTSGVYESDYSGTALPPVIAGSGTSAHDFTGGGANLNEVTEQALNPAPFFTLHWADPVGGSGNDYDLFLLNPAQAAVVLSSTDTQDGDDDPVETINSIGVDHSFHNLVVVKLAGSEDKYIHLNTHEGRLQHSTNGQIFGHPGAVGALAVAAVNVSTAGGPGGVFDGTESVEEFSSDGPRRIYFEADGSPVSVGAVAGGPAGPRGIPPDPFIVRQKPDVAAADGVSTTSSNFTTFFGTSASAPHAAAIAALMIEEIDALMSEALGEAGLPFIVSVSQARGLFDFTSSDIEQSGFDEDSGAGILDTNAALQHQNIFSDGFETGDTSVWTDTID